MVKLVRGDEQLEAGDDHEPGHHLRAWRAQRLPPPGWSILVSSEGPQREAVSVSRQQPDTPAAHVWYVGLLTKREPGRRNRRPIDGVFLAAGSVLLGLSAVIAKSAADNDRAVADALATVLGWAGPLWRTVFVAVLVLAFAIVVDVLLRRRWDLARDLLVAGLVLVGVAMLLGGVVASKWVPMEPHLLSQWGYPEVRLGAATMVLVVVGPELVRPVRLLAIWLVPLAALGAVVFAAALPSAVLGALALGLATAALVRLAVRNGGRRPAGGRHQGCPRDARCRGAGPEAGGPAADRLGGVRRA